MPRDLHGQDPVLGFSKGKDVKGVTTTEPTDLWKAGVMLADLAIKGADGDVSKVDREELRDMVSMLGLKAS